MFDKDISTAALYRLPIYLSYLESLPKEMSMISSTAIADALHLGQVQVRKDLAIASTSGKPKIGYPVQTLIDEIKKFLGYEKTDSAVVIGSGAMSTALLTEETVDCGLSLLAAFDPDCQQENIIVNKTVYPLSQLASFCSRHRVKIGILTAPADKAQLLCDQMVAAGMRVIINFTPVFLNVPEKVSVRPHNLAASIAIYSKNHLYGSH